MSYMMRGQTLVAMPGNPGTVVSEPIVLDQSNRITVVPFVHSRCSPNADPTFKYKSQVSIDGITWVDQGLDISAINPGTGPLPIQQGNVSGSLCRLVAIWMVDGVNPGTGGITFDLSVRADRV